MVRVGAEKPTPKETGRGKDREAIDRPVGRSKVCPISRGGGRATSDRTAPVASAVEGRRPTISLLPLASDGRRLRGDRTVKRRKRVLREFKRISFVTVD